MSGPLLVVGSVNADIYVELKKLPLPGETLEAQKGSGIVLPGGKGANQAFGAARMAKGKQVKFCGHFGDDTHGPTLKKFMSGPAAMDLSLSRTLTDTPTGQAFILLQTGGQNSIIIIGGANTEWDSALPADLQRAITTASGVLLQREIPPRINMLVAKTAFKAGVPVIMDVGGADTDMNPALFPYLNILCPNETELSRVVGMPTETDEEIVAAAKALQGKGVKQVLVTLGKKGCIFLSDKGVLTKKGSFRVSKVVDTTGAGDCFRAAFSVALTEGKSIEESLDFGSAAGALCVQGKGAMPSMPTRTQVEKFLLAQASKL